MEGKLKKINIHINRIVYGILCAIIGFLFVFYLDAITFSLLFLVLIIPFITYGVCRYQFKRLSISLSFDERVIRQNASTKLRVSLVNESILPVANVYIVLTFSNLFEGEDKEYIVNFNGKADSQTDILLEIGSESCACIKAECKGLYMYDYINLYKTNLVEVEEEAVCHVLPVKAGVNADGLPGEDDEEEELEIIGEDVSEIVDIREFRPGDRLSRIHWKLSTKCDEIMVKEFGNIYGNKLILGFELCKEAQYMALDNVLVAVYGFGCMLLENDKAFSIKWYDGYSNNYKEAQVDNESALDSAFIDVLNSGLVDSKQMLYDYEKEVENKKFIYVTNKEGMENYQGEIIGTAAGEVVLLWV